MRRHRYEKGDITTDPKDIGGRIISGYYKQLYANIFGNRYIDKFHISERQSTKAPSKKYR